MIMLLENVQILVIIGHSLGFVTALLFIVASGLVMKLVTLLVTSLLVVIKLDQTKIRLLVSYQPLSQFWGSSIFMLIIEGSTQNHSNSSILTLYHLSTGRNIFLR